MKDLLEKAYKAVDLSFQFPKYTSWVKRSKHLFENLCCNKWWQFWTHRLVTMTSDWLDAEIRKHLIIQLFGSNDNDNDNAMYILKGGKSIKSFSLISIN